MNWITNIILNILFPKKELISKGEIKQSKIRSILKELGTKDIFISDSKYKKANKQMIKDFLFGSPLDMRTYIKETFDCDNFSFSLMGEASYKMAGYAIGIVWADTPKCKHALNFFIDEVERFWFIEPQTDKIFQDSEIKPYLALL